MNNIGSSQPMGYPKGGQQPVSPLSDVQGNDPIAMPSAIYAADTTVKAGKFIKSQGLSTVGVKELFADKTKFSQVLDTGAHVLNNTKEINKQPGIISSLIGNIPGAKQVGEFIGKFNPFKGGGANVGAATNATASTAQVTTAAATTTTTAVAASVPGQLALPSAELVKMGNTVQNANQLSQAANVTQASQVASTANAGVQTAGKGFLSGLGQAMKSNVITSALFAVVGNGVELMTGKQNMAQFVGLTALDTAAFAGIGVAAGAAVAALTLPAWGSVLAAGALAFGAAKVYEAVVRKPAKDALGAIGGGVSAATQQEMPVDQAGQQVPENVLPAALPQAQQTQQPVTTQTQSPMVQMPATSATPTYIPEDNTPNLPSTTLQPTPVAPVTYEALPTALPQSQQPTAAAPIPTTSGGAADPMATQAMMAEVDAYLETLQ
jgi:hypothetical protein